MNVIRHTDADCADRVSALTAASSLFDRTIEDRARAIVEAVYTSGDAGVLEFTERFDGAKLSPEQLAVTQAELLAASLKAYESLRMAVDTARKNIEAFSRKSLRRAWSAKNAQGGRV